MISIADARETASRRLASKLSEWATGHATQRVAESAFSLALGVPTEREVLLDQTAAEEWAGEWTRASLPQDCRLEWTTRSWRSIGAQRVPERLSIADPAAVAMFVGGRGARDWSTLSARVDELRTALGDSAALASACRRHAKRLLALDADTFERVVGVSAWLLEHPVSGLRPRQLPVRGVDSKWFESHRALVSDLQRAAGGADDLGIVDADLRIRVRSLDGRWSAGPVHDLTAPIDELVRLEWDPEVVLVFENLECVLAMPPMEDIVAVHGTGYAVDAVARLPWVARATVIYWGDLDSHGFAILDRLRAHHPHVESVLMDAETFALHRDLAVPEPKPTSATLTRLTDAEAETLVLLRSSTANRLEQERIPWSFALSQLQQAVSARTR